MFLCTVHTSCSYCKSRQKLEKGIHNLNKIREETIKFRKYFGKMSLKKGLKSLFANPPQYKSVKTPRQAEGQMWENSAQQNLGKF
jgi:hypothetical protein